MTRTYQLLMLYEQASTDKSACWVRARGWLEPLRPVGASCLLGSCSHADGDVGWAFVFVPPWFFPSSETPKVSEDSMKTCLVSLSSYIIPSTVHVVDISWKIMKEDPFFLMMATRSISQGKEIWTIARCYFRLRKALLESGWDIFMLNHAFALKRHRACAYKIICDLRIYFDIMHLCVCVCVRLWIWMCVLCPSFGMQNRSILVPHMSHQYFTPSPPHSLLFLSLYLSLPLSLSRVSE